jgi:cyclopropane-fatty-acyl-phospholipid synthase
MYQLLNDDGVALLHSIGSINPPRSPHPWITTYVFPGGYTPSLSQLTVPIEKSGLILSDWNFENALFTYTSSLERAFFKKQS